MDGAEDPVPLASTNSNSNLAVGTATHLHDKDSLAEQRSDLVDWLVEIFSRKLRELARYRAAMGIKSDDEKELASLEREVMEKDELISDEISEVVVLPKFAAAKRAVDPKVMKLSPEVLQQLRDYIVNISLMYHANDFHNFEVSDIVAISGLELRALLCAVSMLLMLP